MIVQLRGTSGSGKSTAMRAVMDALGDWTPEYRPGRRRPLYYRNVDPGWGRLGVVVLGHYESPCGGCDTIGSARAVYDATVKILGAGVKVVLQEGLLLSEDAKWTPLLPGVKVIFLTTPVETCLDYVRARRAAGGNDKPLNEANTRNRVAVIARARARLEAAGVYCRAAAADQATGVVTKWLREAS